MTAVSRAAIVSGLVVLLAAAGSVRAADPAPRHDAGFAVRMVELGGDPGEADTRAHLRFCRELGFNAVWVRSGDAGVWTKDAAPTGPRLSPSFLSLTRWCRRHGMDVWVSLEPATDAGERFFFTDDDGERRLLQFGALLRQQAEVRQVALSFANMPMQLRELSDIFRYGANAAEAQLDLARRFVAAMPADVATWLRASAVADAELGDGTSPYATSFVKGLGSLPPGVGIVWAGPKRRSPAITRAGLEASRARLGNRPLLLDDHFPANGNNDGDAMALILGALRGREPGIREVVAGYLVRPETPLAGSRLSLITIARFLRDPERYDPDIAAAAAVTRLAGPRHDAQTALTTQQLEWGGVIDGRNDWPRDELNPAVTARRLNDPAFVDSFTWTVARYPGRMADLAHVADRRFRADLLRTMRYRLAIARVVPLAIDYVARVQADRPDAADVLARIDAERQSWARSPDVRRVLELFLSAASIPPNNPAP